MVMRGVGLVVGVTGDISGLQKSLGQAGGDVKGFGGISLATAAKVTVIGGAVVMAAEALWELGKAADADRTEAKKLAAAIDAAGAATGDWTAQVDAAIVAGQAKAFSDSETRAGLQALVTSTGSVTEATTLLATAQDIARLRGVDLATASDAIAKAVQGSDGALRKLIPGLEKGATATDTIANAQKAAAGQADIFADSAEGGAMKTADAMGELGETIGEVLLPLMDALIPAILPIIAAFGKLIKAILPVLIPMVQLLAKYFGFVATVLSTVIGFVADLIGWIGRLLAPLGSVLDALAALNPFGDIIGMVTGGGTGGSTTGGTGGPFTAIFNIHGDPATIERTVIGALRDYDRRNGYTVTVAR